MRPPSHAGSTGDPNNTRLADTPIPSSSMREVDAGLRPSADVPVLAIENQFRAVAQVQLFVDVVEVGLDRPLADCLVRVPHGHYAQDLDLSRGQELADFPPAGLPAQQRLEGPGRGAAL